MDAIGPHVDVSLRQRLATGGELLRADVAFQQDLPVVDQLANKTPRVARGGVKLSKIERHSLMTSTTPLSVGSTITTSLPAMM